MEKAFSDVLRLLHALLVATYKLLPSSLSMKAFWAESVHNL